MAHQSAASLLLNEIQVQYQIEKSLPSSKVNLDKSSRSELKNTKFKD